MRIRIVMLRAVFCSLLTAVALGGSSCSSEPEPPFEDTVDPTVCKSDSMCNDFNACTEDRCLVDGTCSYTVDTTTACDDGNQCTVGDHCGADGGCEGGDPLECEESNGCMDYTGCDPEAGCQYKTKTDIGDCDGNPCTADFCNPDTYLCEATGNQPDGTECDDGDDNLCTVGACEGGTCKSATVECTEPDDVKDCVIPYCAEETGTCSKCSPGDAGCDAHFEMTGVPCEDGNGCTIDDACSESGVCEPGKGKECVDINPCVPQTCISGQKDEQGFMTSTCKPDPAPEGTECDDGNKCTKDDACVADAGLVDCVGIPKECDDGNPCTDDTCDAGEGCMSEFNNDPCQSDSYCGLTGKCAEGKCGPPIDLSCDDGSACTTDDQCENSVCAGTAIECGDEFFCNGIEICDPELGCLEGPAPIVDDGVPCTKDLCDEEADEVVHLPQDADCDDADVCNGNETCDMENGCLAGTPLECEDLVECTIDECDPVAGCSNTPDDSLCNDGVGCTLDSCDAIEDCQNDPDDSLCEDGITCTLNTCDPVQDCVLLEDDTVCDDQISCTVDQCDTDADCLNNADDALCDDNNCCTANICDEQQDCLYSFFDSCGIDGFCCKEEDAECNDGNPCTLDTCNFDLHQCAAAAMAENASCNDKNACTENTTCQGGACLGDTVNCPKVGICKVGFCDKDQGCVYTQDDGLCSDGKDCTDDVCLEGGDCDHPLLDAVCQIEGMCYDDGQEKDDNVCLKCDAGADAEAWTANDGEDCDDTNASTADDLCSNGACVGLADPDQDGVANNGYLQTCTEGQTESCNDNCPELANPDQADANGNGIGDLCDCLPDCCGKECGNGGCPELPEDTCGVCAQGECIGEQGVCVAEGWVLVPGGTFTMGSPGEGDPGGPELCSNPDDEGPLHEVTITHAMLVSDHEVTQGEWTTVTGAFNPSHFGPNGTSGADKKCDSADCPVEKVNWFEAVTYCNLLSQSEGLDECYALTGCTGTIGGTYSCTEVAFSGVDCEGYRLPTEAENEYFTRAGTQTPLPYPVPDGGGVASCGCYNDPNFAAYEWYCDNSSARTHPVKQKLPNGWGLHDITGNVSEWCWDRYDANYYSVSPGIDPLGPASGAQRMRNGGHWGTYPGEGRSAARSATAPSENMDHVGFRPVRSLPIYGCEGKNCGEDGCGGFCGECDQGSVCHMDVCVSDQISCAALLHHHPLLAGKDGIYAIDPDGNGPGAAYDVFCDMTHDGGGWTLVAVSSDDFQNTWTWNNKEYWSTDPTVFGSLNSLNKDFKSHALHHAPARDLLFVHHPSTVWASYHNAGDGQGPLSQILTDAGAPKCYGGDPAVGITMTAGTLSKKLNLCSTDLFLNAQDQDGNSVCDTSSNEKCFGPCWSANDNSGCPLDDVGARSSLGTCGATSGQNGDKEYCAYPNAAIGFGWALELNDGVPGAAENYMHVFVRTACGCNGNECGDGCGGSCGEECCDPACDPSLEECVQTTTDGRVCASKMVEIPAGSFWMGCNDPLDPHCTCPGPECPYHQVTTPKYWIDATETTNAQYVEYLKVHGNSCLHNEMQWDCVDIGDEDVQVAENDGFWSVQGQKHDHPVVEVTWHGAKAYCDWRCPKCRLCSEAEWEKAARGGCEHYGNCAEDSRIWPWGNEFPTPCEENVVVCSNCQGAGATCEVGENPEGKSLYDVHDMAGNVWEWVADSWHESYIGAPQDGNAWLGEWGDDRVFRSGGWGSVQDFLRVSRRSGHERTVSTSDLGFRCCRFE